MRRFHFEYGMELRFSEPAARHSFLYRFLPMSNEFQLLWGVETACDPACALPAQRDAFGNACACGHIERAHDALMLRTSGEALILGGPQSAPCPDWYALPTALTQADADIRALADGLPQDPVEAALAACGRIQARMAYRRGTTDERTTAAQALSQGTGVCQDMAHVLISALRSRGIPCRYAAGLIPGEGETHAWAEVYDGGRFIGVDPTHQRLTDDGYLRVSCGRDGRDCAINRGVFAGGARQTIRVRASMTEI